MTGLLRGSAPKMMARGPLARGGGMRRTKSAQHVQAADGSHRGLGVSTPRALQRRVAAISSRVVAPSREKHSVAHGEADATELQRQGLSPFLVNVLAGGGAGLIETTITYPLDVIKTRQQLVKGRRSVSLIHVAQGIVREEGFSRLYRGLLPPIISEVPRRAVKFTANDVYKNLLTPAKGSRGTLTGMTETVVHTPWELMKVRLQSRDHLRVRNTWECAKEIAASEGFVGLYRGFEAYLLRQGLWNGSFFGVISFIRHEVPLEPSPSRARRLSYDFCTGLVAGTVATCLNTPLDVAKTVLQNDAANRAGTAPWSLAVVMRLWREEGVRGCFRGLNARLYRSAPGSGILLLGYEAISHWLRP